MARKSTGKRLRFEVFKRDYFTCQYCGAQPPAVVLVVDHVTPVAAGGGTTADNLVTACEACNQGKGARSLGDVAPRLDADLLYLSTQQEVAEMRRYQAAIADREDAINEMIPLLQQVWLSVTCLDWHPTDQIVRQLLDKYPVEVVDEALRDVAVKVAGGYLHTKGRKWVGYLFTVARNLNDESEDGDDY